MKDGIGNLTCVMHKKRILKKNEMIKMYKEIKKEMIEGELKQIVKLDNKPEEEFDCSLSTLRPKSNVKDYCTKNGKIKY
jgi:hypothetical protein